MPAPLDYAPPVSWRRRRSLHRWLIFGALLLTLGASVRWAPPAWRQAQLLYWQRQVISYIAPEDLVVFDRRQPVTRPKQWSEFARLLPETLLAPFYIHRQSPDGQGRIIAIGVTDMYSAETSHQLWFSTVYRPASLLPQSYSPVRSGGLILRVDRLYAPQPDPDDPSHFTIAYELDGKPGVIDGWLMDDDTVKFEPRDWRKAGPQD